MVIRQQQENNRLTAYPHVGDGIVVSSNIVDVPAVYVASVPRVSIASSRLFVGSTLKNA